MVELRSIAESLVARQTAALGGERQALRHKDVHDPHDFLAVEVVEEAVCGSNDYVTLSDISLVKARIGDLVSPKFFL